MRREGHGNANAGQPLPGPDVGTKRRGLDARAQPAQAAVKTPHGDAVPPGPPGSAHARGAHRGRRADLRGLPGTWGSAAREDAKAGAQACPVPSTLHPLCGSACRAGEIHQESQAWATGAAYTRSARAQRSEPMLVPWPMRQPFRGWPAAYRHLCPTAPALDLHRHLVKGRPLRGSLGNTGARTLTLRPCSVVLSQPIFFLF